MNIKSKTANSITAIVCAAVVAGMGVLLTTSVPTAEAAPPASQDQGKSDRLPTRVTGAACSTRGWPLYEQACQFDLRRAADDIPTVRIIALR